MRIQTSFIQIDGVGEITERELWEAGVTRWEEAAEETWLRKNQRQAIESFAAEARPRVDAADIAYFSDRLPGGEQWRLTDTFGDRCTALDIETTGLDQFRDHVTAVSVHGPKGTETLVRGRDLNRGRLDELVADIDLLVTFNGKRFDVPFLESAFGIEVDVPHLDLMYPCRKLGLTGGLKAVECRLGIDREVPDVDGREAVRLWHQHEAGDEEALDRLIRYNREDTRTLLPIVEHLHWTLEREIFEPYVPTDSPAQHGGSSK